MYHTEEFSTLKLSKTTSSVLLIAEDPSFIAPILAGVFHEIFIASTQHESLAFFYDKHIDLVMIDIDTQAYDWLFLVNQFRSKLYDISIALILDLDQTKDLNAIYNAGVMQCLFKPLDAQKLKFSLFDLMNKIQAKKDAKENYYLQERRKLNMMAISTVKQIIENIPAPIFAYNKHERILFFNKVVAALFYDKKLPIPEMLHVWNIEDLFDNMTKELHFATIQEGKSHELKYSYEHGSIKKIFIPTKFIVKLETSEEPYNVIVLTDIAPLLMQMQMIAYT